MYDSSATLALTGSGVTILGQASGITALAIGGAFLVGTVVVMKVARPRSRRRT